MDIDYDNIPNPHMTYSVRHYIEHGAPFGHFLTALFSNNLFEATARADAANQAALIDWTKWIYNQAPTGCWGSRAKVSAWQKQGGLAGAERAA